MEVGIEDCLHIEFEYDKGRYHLKDTVVGKIYFLLVRLFMTIPPCLHLLWNSLPGLEPGSALQQSHIRDQSSHAALSIIVLEPTKGLYIDGYSLVLGEDRYRLPVLQSQAAEHAGIQKQCCPKAHGRSMKFVDE